jgi:hypothetical protein
MRGFWDVCGHNKYVREINETESASQARKRQRGGVCGVAFFVRRVYRGGCVKDHNAVIEEEVVALLLRGVDAYFREQLTHGARSKGSVGLFRVLEVFEVGVACNLAAQLLRDLGDAGHGN